MPFNFKLDKSKLNGQEPVPAGIYTVLFTGFKPAWSKKGDTLNYNPSVEIVNDPNYENRKLFTSLNSAIPSFIQDFVNSFGLEMEGDESSDDISIPGTFDADPEGFNETDPKTWVYAGPLEGKTAQWEIGETTYEGKPRNEVVRFIPVQELVDKYPEVKHSTDMRRKSK
jgi:hypothetical protein